MNKGENRKILWPILIAVALITANLVCSKFTTLATNIELSNAVIIYPFTYLFVLLIARFIDHKYAKKTVYMVVITQVLFLLGLMLVSALRSNADSAFNRAYIEYLLTPNHFTLFGLNIAYPDLIYYGFSITAFTLGHIIAVKIFKSIEESVPKVFAFGISYYLAYIIDTIIFVGGYNVVQMLIDDNFKLVSLVRKLTGQFIGLFISGIIMIIVFTILNAILKKHENKEEQIPVEEPKMEYQTPVVTIEQPMIQNVTPMVNEPIQQATPVINEPVVTQAPSVNSVTVDDLPTLK